MIKRTRKNKKRRRRRSGDVCVRDRVPVVDVTTAVELECGLKSDHLGVVTLGLGVGILLHGGVEVRHVGVVVFGVVQGHDLRRHVWLQGTIVVVERGERCGRGRELARRGGGAGSSGGRLAEGEHGNLNKKEDGLGTGVWCVWGSVHLVAFATCKKGPESFGSVFSVSHLQIRICVTTRPPRPYGIIHAGGRNTSPSPHREQDGSHFNPSPPPNFANISLSLLARAPSPPDD